MTVGNVEEKDLTTEEFMFVMKAKRAAGKANLYPCSFTSADMEEIVGDRGAHNLNINFKSETEYSIHRMHQFSDLNMFNFSKARIPPKYNTNKWTCNLPKGISGKTIMVSTPKSDDDTFQKAYEGIFKK
jgi:hypothetical protein